MLHALLKIKFTRQSEHMSEVTESINLCSKIKRKFNLLARASFNHDQLDYIIVSALGESETQLDKIFDNLLKFCESSSFGRIYQSNAFVEEIANIEELSDNLTPEYEQ